MESIILIISALITSGISAVFGMGGGIILLGIMAALIPEGYMVIALHGIIQLVSNTTRPFVFKKYLQTKLIKDFLFGAIGINWPYFGGSLIMLIVLVLSIKNLKKMNP